MHEFCPLCLKNGNKVRIKSCQLNYQEAVLICATLECPWPFGYKDFTFVKRPVGEEWSRTWDESVLQYAKNEHDPLPDLSCYTPPQTPSSEVVWKDAANGSVPCCTSIPNQVSTSVSRIANENLHQSLDTYSVLSKQNQVSVDNIINNKTNAKAEVVCLKALNYTVERQPVESNTLKQKNGNSDTRSEFKTEMDNYKGNKNISTSLANNLIQVNNNKLVNTLANISICKEKSKEGLRVLVKKRKRLSSSQKFDFHELMTSESTKVNEKCKSDLNIKAKYQLKENIKHKNSAQSSAQNLAQNLNDFTIKGCSSNESIKSKYTTVDCDGSNLGHRNVYDIDSCNNKTDKNSHLALSYCSKDSEVDQDLIKKDVDLQLEELLAGFSDDISSSAKNNVTGTDEYEWINSLFE